MVADDPRFPPPAYLPGDGPDIVEQTETSLSKVLKIINALSEIDARDLDALSVEDLAQFWYWLTKHQGSIFVKSVGRLGIKIEDK